MSIIYSRQLSKREHKIRNIQVFYDITLSNNVSYSRWMVAKDAVLPNLYLVNICQNNSPIDLVKGCIRRKIFEMY